MARPNPESGFTIVELMVSITITTVVVAALYSVSRATTETFNQQQRAAEMQLRLRLAMERLRADVARAGYMATPNSEVDARVCPKPTVLLQPFSITRALSGTNPIPRPTDNAFVQPVTLRMLGNYTTADEYLVENITGNLVHLQHRTPQWAARMSPSEFTRVFISSDPTHPRMIRISSPTGTMQFYRVRSGTYQAPSSATNPELILDATPTVVGDAVMMGAGAGCGIAGLGTGSTVAPVDLVEYAIRSGATMRTTTLSDLYPSDATEAALKTDLVRSEWAIESTSVELANSAQLVGEYAVDLDATVTTDEATGVSPVSMRAFAWGDDSNINRYAQNMMGSGSASGHFPQRIRSVLLRLSIRDRLQDPSFGWVARSASTVPLSRFRVYSDRLGAARVRTLTSEVVLTNLAARNLR